ncbi:MAG: DUF3857 domain-containing transglutaminase family protein [Chitinophagales bacterium]|nr:DUF3857 domain-containing transglutaminase family protein [Chitinophagales bacterium]
MKPFSLILICLAPACLPAQIEYPVFTITPELRKHANVIVRNHETIFRVEADGGATVEETYVATILNEEGKDASIMTESEDPFQKVKMLKGRVFDAMGQLVRNSKDEDIQLYGGAAEYEFSDSRVKYLRMEYPQFPYTVEFRKKTVLKNFLFAPSSILQSLGVAVEHWHYRLEAPSGYKFQWKSQGIDLKVKESQKGNTSIWEWDAGQLPALPAEPHNPYFNDVTASLMFAFEEVNYDGARGKFKDWKSVGDFFYGLNNGRETLTPQTIELVKKLTDGKSNREKIAILYKLTQEQCRYVSIQLGIGGWQTLEAEFVDKKKYGDCKALSNYTQALLKVAGIESWEASIYGSDEGAPACDESFPRPRFNHMILYIPSEDMWLECTSKSNPVGYMGQFTADRCALLFTPDGGKLVKTPAIKLQDNYEQTTTTLSLREDGTAQVSGKAFYGGARQDDLRHYALEKTKEEWEKVFMQQAKFSIGKLGNLALDANRDKPEVGLDFQVESPKYATVSGKRMFVPLTKTNPFKRSLPANETRVLDLQMLESYALADTFVLQFPSGYGAENVPAGKKITSEYGVYELKTETLSDAVKVIRLIEMYPIQAPAAKYSEVRQFFLDITKADAQQMVLLKKT